MAQNGPKWRKLSLFGHGKPGPLFARHGGQSAIPELAPNRTLTGPQRSKLRPNNPKWGQMCPLPPARRKIRPKIRPVAQFWHRKSIQRVENGLGRSPQGAQPTLFILTRILPRRGPPNREFDAPPPGLPPAHPWRSMFKLLVDRLELCKNGKHFIQRE